MTRISRLAITSLLFAAACADQTSSSNDPALDNAATVDESLPTEDAIVVRDSDLPFSEELAGRVANADMVIYVASNGARITYVGSQAVTPEGVPPMRVVRELGGDIVLGHQQDLPGMIEQRGHDGVGLPIGNGGLWPDSTVGYIINSNVVGSDLVTVKAAITAWNRATDGSGNPLKVRYVPRYANDSRPYVQFVKGGSGGCGLSHVGRADNIFTNWYSHDINIDCFSVGVIQHEMGHTVGLYHEHQRCDRDTYVNVGAPAGINCERYCGGNSVDYGPYNYLSVMHYPYNNSCSITPRTPGGSWFHGMPSDAGQRVGLDSFDVSAINQMYSGITPSLPLIGSTHPYSLQPIYTSRVVIVPGGSATDGAELLLWDRYAGFRDQSVIVEDAGEGYVKLHPGHQPTKCYEDLSFMTTNGAAIGQWTCWGGDNQLWIVAPHTGSPGQFEVINKYSGKALDINAVGNFNGARVQQWDHNNGDNQRFVLSPAWW
ncbi:MAG: M12 family metallopeptidase [Kofleriaceae bacterium]